MLLNEMEIFYYVVELHSFSKAAQQLGVSKSYVSKRITRLEQELKSKLLIRNTRKVALTQAGQHFYHYCQGVVQSAQQGYSKIQDLQARPTGKLKISAPPAFGKYVLAPLLKDFMRDYPDITLEIVLESRLVDVIQEGCDLVLRAAVLPDSGLVAQQVMLMENQLCAAPEYLAKHGIPTTPQQLANHVFALYQATTTFKWNSHRTVAMIETPLYGAVVTNQMDFMKQLILEGSCMGVLPTFMIQKELQAGSVLPCLTDYTLGGSPLYAIYPQREFLPPKVRVLLERLLSLSSRGAVIS